MVDPELESALQAREKGQWNEAWAERYATEKDDAKLAYDEVSGFLDESRKRRTDELGRLRRTRAIMAMAVVLFAGLAVVAVYFALSASRARGKVRVLWLMVRVGRSCGVVDHGG